MGSLKKNIGFGLHLAQYDDFKDPIYIRITPQSVYITNIIEPGSEPENLDVVTTKYCTCIKLKKECLTIA